MKSKFLFSTLVIFMSYSFKAQVTESTNTVTSSSSYLGTSNNYDVIFKRGNSNSGIISNNSVSFGLGSVAGVYDVSIGYGAGLNDQGVNNVFVGTYSGRACTLVGTNCMFLPEPLNNVTFVGYRTGEMSVGDGNVFLGSSAGMETTGNDNIMIGNESGKEITGSNNIIIGKSVVENQTLSNSLIIDSSQDAYPLIFGDFSQNQLKFNGKVGVGYGFSSYPTSIGSVDISAYNLFVKGGVLAEEIRVTLQSNWADYVFSEDYNLPTLNEVEKHIKEKGHLINVPSSKEIKESGIDLGEMAKIQQEKIEELTLYLIEQKKVNESQEEQIKELKDLVQLLLEKSK
ncbi:hypothetical protein [Flavobacterium sp. U410]